MLVFLRKQRPKKHLPKKCELCFGVKKAERRPFVCSNNCIAQFADLDVKLSKGVFRPNNANGQAVLAKCSLETVR